MKKIIMFVISSLFLTLGGCLSDDSESTTPAVTFVAVDPYIEGARFCEDINKNGQCDSGEQLSTASNASGQFSFSNDLAAGAIVITDPTSMGTHNGQAYELQMQVDTATFNNNIITPLTTFANNKGLQIGELKDLLIAAGLTTVLESDLTVDPVAELNTITTGSESNTDTVFRRLHASIAVYGFLRLLEESSALKLLTHDEILASGKITGYWYQGVNEGINQILTAMVTNISTTLNTTYYSLIKNQLSALNGAFVAAGVSAPTIDASMIVDTAMVVMEMLVDKGASVCNSTGGDYNSALTSINTIISDSGFSNAIQSVAIRRMMGKYRSNFEALQSRMNLGFGSGSYTNGWSGGTITFGGIGHDMDAGLACSSGYPTIDENLSVGCAL